MKVFGSLPAEIAVCAIGFSSFYLSRWVAMSTLDLPEPVASLTGVGSLVLGRVLKLREGLAWEKVPENKADANGAMES